MNFNPFAFRCQTARSPAPRTTAGTRDMTDFLLLAFVFLIAGVIAVPIATRFGLGRCWAT
jgi:hypothetical protein